MSKPKAPAPAWANRITGYGEEAPDQLLANPANWRIHPKQQQDALSGILADVGIVQNVLVNKQTGHLVDGHLRVTLAMREHQPTIPVTYVDLSPAEEAEILATLDPVAAMAGADREKLDALLREFNTGNAATQEMLAKLSQKPVDFDEAWQGMPEFHQEDKLGVRQIIVHFKAEEDCTAFAELVQQPITDKTKFIWYPGEARNNYIDTVWHEQS